MVSKPKGSTLVSLGIFLVIAYGLGVWSAVSIPKTGEVNMFKFVLTVFLFFVAVVVTSRILWTYRSLRLSKHQWQVHYLLRPDVKFKTEDIEWWQITNIKTRGGLYQELQVRTDTNDGIKISPQEHTGFDPIFDYLKKKCHNKRRPDL